MTVQRKRSSEDKIQLFKSLFFGRSDVYGTYDTSSGKAWQVKAAVTDGVIKAHLLGKHPYGIYLLVGDKTSAIVADFDSSSRLPPFEFVSAAEHYGLKAYIERSKAKGYHAWIFFDKKGASAAKARRVVQHILDEIEEPGIEIFPKHDRLTSSRHYGNFINAPLFGALVPMGKTVFLELSTFSPFANQWDFLGSVDKNGEFALDDVIALNDLSVAKEISLLERKNPENNGYGLPHCAQKMLRDGVVEFQRVACFRLAVHFKRLGLPYDIAEYALQAWARKNRPRENKRIITSKEIRTQATCAYKKEYRGYGCDSEAVAPFCHPECPVISRLSVSSV